ncbi:hypothetical protein [Azospirillum picis]|uniref:Uncharacterized protein n=1 Tax=Azospirillum picis TaxID=488438 RepID=A0ABU0MDQ2_9PROT|nr:hypothetical protein [Azospirillum picis]MBP2297414.1 hypothetical protein [Azospirillum picis]MDQ0531563.1 hypothetical protein [Azospirillum picis]
MRITAALILSGLLAGLPAFGAGAQQPAPSADTAPASAGDALARDPKVQESQDPHPSAQGTRPPNPSSSADTGGSDLQQALADVRRAPPDLNGTPVPRPNPLASEPDQPNEPTRSQNPSDLSSQEVK